MPEQPEERAAKETFREFLSNRADKGTFIPEEPANDRAAGTIHLRQSEIDYLAFDEVMNGNKPDTETIEGAFRRLGNAYNGLSLMVSDPKTQRTVSGEGMARLYHKQSIAAAQSLKENLEGRQGGRGQGAE